MPLTIVKCGGAALAKEPFVLDRYVESGSGVCVVHGAGARISAALPNGTTSAESVPS